MRKDKLQLTVGHVRVETLGYTLGAQKGSKYKVFEIEDYGDSFGVVCELLEAAKEPVVKFQPDHGEPLREIGVAAEVWREGNWFVKVLVKDW